jgi:hypothetical protein
VADDYIKDFLEKHKAREVSLEAEKAAEEEERKQLELKKQEQVVIAQKTPTLWHNLTLFINSKVAEINKDKPVMQLQSVIADELILRYGNNYVKLTYDRAAQVIRKAAKNPSSKDTLTPIFEGGEVKLADIHGNPVTFDQIMQGLLQELL